MENTRKYKLHARVTKEIEVTEEQMERFCNYLCGCCEHNNIDDIRKAFLTATDSGDYEKGYIPQAWIEADLEQLVDGDEIKQRFFEENQNFDDIDLF